MTTPLSVFLAIWQERIPADVLPYMEAVNFQHDTNTAPDQWGAAIVQPEQRGDVTLGSHAVGRGDRHHPDRPVHALGLRPGCARPGGRLHPPDLPRPAHATGW